MCPISFSFKIIVTCNFKEILTYKLVLFFMIKQNSLIIRVYIRQHLPSVPNLEIIALRTQHNISVLVKLTKIKFT